MYRSSKRVFLSAIDNPNANEKGKEKEKEKEKVSWADMDESPSALLLSWRFASIAERNVRLLCLLIGLADKEVLNVYQHGSHVWGTSHALSDWFANNHLITKR